MKKVFSSSAQCIHVFAQQSQDEGHAGNVFFEGKTLYSYGRHFAIASFIDKKTVLFNKSTYSSTTSGHQSAARSALSQYNILYCYDPSERFTIGNVWAFLRIIDNAVYEMITRKLRPAGIARELGNIQTAHQELQKYCNAFGEDMDKRIEGSLNSMPNAAIYFAHPQRFATGYAVILSEAKAKSDAERLEYFTNGFVKVEKLYKRYIQLWRDNAETPVLAKARDKYSAIAPMKFRDETAKRIAKKYGEALRILGDEVITSLGARVSLKEAKLLYRAFTAGKPIHGAKIGYFTVLSADSDRIVIGCHTIVKAEIELFGKMIAK